MAGATESGGRGARAAGAPGTIVASADPPEVTVAGTTRGAFLLRGALAAGAAYGAGAVSPFVGRALAQSGGPDGEILNFALTLEYLEAEFYRRALRLALRPAVRALAKLLGRHEAEHVVAIKALLVKLGDTPVVSPRFQFPMHDQRSFLALARLLEDTGVGAYNGAAPQIQSVEVLASAGSIVQIEARHAAAIRLAADRAPAPGAFDAAFDKQQVLTRVDPYVTTAPLTQSG